MTAISCARTICMTWYAHNRISQMQINSIPVYSHQYDPSGYRIKKNAGELLGYLEAELADRGMDNVMVSTTGCLKSSRGGQRRWRGPARPTGSSRIDAREAP